LAISSCVVARFLHDWAIWDSLCHLSMWWWVCNLTPSSPDTSQATSTASTSTRYSSLQKFTPSLISLWISIKGTHATPDMYWWAHSPRTNV
jgi:hypothetical protein